MLHPFKCPKGIVPALDTPDLDKISDVVCATAGIEQVVAFKVGGIAAETHGLKTVVKTIRQINKDAHIIYDRQKGATDIPDLGKDFAKVWQDAGVDSVILFPLTGPTTQTTWTNALFEANLTPWIGGHMTHDAYIEHQGGYIANLAPAKIYKLAAEQDVTHFIVPGNNPGLVNEFREIATDGRNCTITLGAPGFVAQGGSISEAGAVAGDNWVAIIGRAILTQPDIGSMRNTALELVSQLG